MSYFVAPACPTIASLIKGAPFGRVGEWEISYTNQFVELFRTEINRPPAELIEPEYSQEIQDGEFMSAAQRRTLQKLQSSHVCPPGIASYTLQIDSKLQAALMHLTATQPAADAPAGMRTLTVQIPSDLCAIWYLGTYLRLTPRILQAALALRLGDGDMEDYGSTFASIETE